MVSRCFWDRSLTRLCTTIEPAAYHPFRSVRADLLSLLRLSTNPDVIDDVWINELEDFGAKVVRVEPSTDPRLGQTGNLGPYLVFQSVPPSDVLHF